MTTTSQREQGWMKAGLIVAVVAAIVVLTATGALAARRWVPPAAETEAQLRQAVVGFELAQAPSRPARMVGKKLTAGDKAALQARYLRRLERYAGGPELQQSQDWDYAAALREDEWDVRELTGCTGAMVYWDFQHRDADGSVQVRAGVEKHHTVVTWDAAAGRAVPYDDWVTGVVVNQYTLKQVDGAWKVFGTRWWRFYDPATGGLTTGP